MLNLSGKRALVCGASKGIGAASAKILAEAGAQVILLARDEAQLKSVAANLPNKPIVMAQDLSDRKTLKSKLEEILKQLGSIEILVCNTGGPKGGPIALAEEDEFLSAFQNHVLVNSLLVKTLLPGMKKQNYGRVINVISTSVKVPIPNLGVSNTIRAAVANWAKTLSLEVGEFNVTVNNVLPGFTETDRLQSLIEKAAETQNKSEEEIIKLWKATIPMRRFAKPEETAQAILFLASPMASYINGVNLPVDGGRTGCL